MEPGRFIVDSYGRWSLQPVNQSPTALTPRADTRGSPAQHIISPGRCLFSSYNHTTRADDLLGHQCSSQKDTIAILPCMAVTEAGQTRVDLHRGGVALCAKPWYYYYGGP